MLKSLTVASIVVVESLAINFKGQSGETNFA